MRGFFFQNQGTFFNFHKRARETLYPLIPSHSASCAPNVSYELLGNTRNCHPAGIYLLKVNNGNTRTMCEICQKLTIKTPERRRLVLPLLTLNK